MPQTSSCQTTVGPNYYWNKYWKTKLKEAEDPEPSKYWKECQERLATTHKRQHSFDPTYMTDRFKEYKIRHVHDGWKIYAHKGGFVNKALMGRFSTFKLAEDLLIRFIKQRNVSGYARYPGCPKPQPTDFIGHLLKDWSPKPVH